MKRKPNKERKLNKSIQRLLKKLPKDYVRFLANRTGLAKKYPELKEYRSDK